MTWIDGNKVHWTSGDNNTCGISITVDDSTFGNNIWGNDFSDSSSNGIITTRIIERVVEKDKNSGGDKLDIETIKDFKKLSPEDKVIFIMDHADSSKAVKLLAMWLAELEKKVK